MQMQVEELFRRLAELKKRKLEDHEESDHISITSFENPFQKYKQMRQLIDHDEYLRDSW